MTVLVAIPVWGRPERAQPVLDSLRASERIETLEPVFLCNPEDTDKHAACEATGATTITVPWANGPGDYARKINHALALGNHDWIFTGADDLHFHPGWADHAIRMHQRFRRRVLGTNDLGNPAVQRGRHSTHSLVHRSYAEQLGTIDQPGLIYHDGYHHNWCDAELVETAKARGEFLFAPRAYVEHLHPHWHKGQMDATYRHGLAHFKPDRQLFMRRRTLWNGTTRRGRGLL